MRDKFQPSALGDEARIKSTYRNNLCLNLDQLYSLSDDELRAEVILSHRAQSLLLKMIDHLMYDEQWLSFADAAPYPICDMRYCDYWSTQVSYYGNDDHYRWHYDTIPGDTSRIITMIYYFHSLPKKFSGGQLCLTDGLLWGENIVGQSATTEIEPQNNRLVIFDSKYLHTVLPVSNNVSFHTGRFSANIWIGRSSE